MTADEAVDAGPTAAGVQAQFVDTNVFLRFLTNDIPERAAAVEALFRRAAAGEVRLLTNSMVIAELVWVLESFYGLGRAEVLERALAVAHMDGLILAEIDLITDALFVYETARMNFIDAYNACWMKEQGLSTAATFDENHFSRVDWVTIERPGHASSAGADLSLPGHPLASYSV